MISPVLSMEPLALTSTALPVMLADSIAISK